MGDFDHLWDCPKKHTKRRDYWLPHAKAIRDRLPQDRGFRYLTFCARSMIDVFLLAKEKILAHESDYSSIADVVFCEENFEDYEEIQSLLGSPGAGFAHKLEDLVLFVEDATTAQYPSVTSINNCLEEFGPSLSRDIRERLFLKRNHLQFCEKFPFDFINLDFCSHYYSNVPGILQINNTVKEILALQQRTGKDDKGAPIKARHFLLSVTCRFDNFIPSSAIKRLENTIKDNISNYGEYAEAVREMNKPTDPKVWRLREPFEFFMSAWPKELLSLCKARGWKMEMKDVVYYWRGQGRNRYRIVCLIAEFERSSNLDFYMQESIRALDPKCRTFIEDNPKESIKRKTLLADLNEIVDIRNRRATKLGLETLPAPVFH